VSVFQRLVCFELDELLEGELTEFYLGVGLVMVMLMRMVMVMLATRAMFVVTLFGVISCFLMLFGLVGLVMVLLLLTVVFMAFFVFVMVFILWSLLVVFTERIAKVMVEGY
jgi:hypothetical protein